MSMNWTKRFQLIAKKVVEQDERDKLNKQIEHTFIES